MITAWVLCLILVSCKKHDIRCDDAMQRMCSLTFKGGIFICNGQPPFDNFLRATATFHANSSGSMSVHLVTDSALIDTWLTYKVRCTIAEDSAGFLLSTPGQYEGQYNSGPYRVSFYFPYSSCTRNTWFEGMAQ
jgi:hypothetical protein